MICKNCQMEILAENVNGYCSTECQEREKIRNEISNFILFATHKNEQEHDELYNDLTNYMTEVYEYTK